MRVSRSPAPAQDGKGGIPLEPRLILVLAGEDERRRQIADRRIRVARRERRQTKPALDEFENRDRLVLVIIDDSLADEWRNDDSGNSNTHAPAVRAHRRSHVVPTASVLVVRDD